ncbi:peptide-methionine (S)-S-oxide reductase MsrA [uncultured Polaribacter sp.]|uniref:peptide-methionine (S)-S-oxide reductase MsrA n=1 Tax=uncultured Polaribacter sp. TaxID=174711 RepID=UPI0026056737|nr:peptide-methionine (S)-S-oxide reductase MsrA [uncultured Polaribacter sp.]
MEKNIQVATLGGGCFWCTEAVFQEVKGVEKVVSGYAGGNAPGKPTYREICSGLTGHAEVIQITFNANIISFEDILVIFMTTHDPTTLNRQGADRGTQYRSVIFYHNALQKQISEEVLKQIQVYYKDVIVTELSALPIFYEAEEEHQNYYRQNSEQGYCSYVIAPKLSKLRQLHADKLIAN